MLIESLLFKPGPYSCVARTPGDCKAHEEEMTQLGIKVSQPAIRKSTVRSVEITTAEQYRFLENAEWIHCKASTRPITGLEPPPDGFKFEIPEHEPAERAIMRSLAQCAMRVDKCQGPTPLSKIFQLPKCAICNVSRPDMYECYTHAVAVCSLCVGIPNTEENPFGSGKPLKGIQEARPKPAPERAEVDWPGSSIPWGFDMHIDLLATAPAPSPPSTI